MKFRLKRALLIIVAGFDGQPIPEASLISAAQAMQRHESPSDGDVKDALKDCEAEGYLTAATDDFTKERSWTLTDKGVHQARKLR